MLCTYNCLRNKSDIGFTKEAEVKKGNLNFVMIPDDVV